MKMNLEPVILDIRHPDTGIEKMIDRMSIIELKDGEPVENLIEHSIYECEIEGVELKENDCEPCALPCVHYNGRNGIAIEVSYWDDEAEQYFTRIECRILFTKEQERRIKEKFEEYRVLHSLN